MPSVVLDQVSRHFGQAAAVDKLDLKVEDQEFMTLLGASGCGKTTTLRMVAGLEHNDAGSIAIGDTVVSDPGRGIFVPPDRRQLGMVFQSYAIWPHMTVFENVAYPLAARRAPAASIASQVHKALEMVEMAAYADRPAPALSGGQQQRVAIARALVSQPQVLLMDEPLSNLDAKLREQMRVELRELQRRLGITTIYVTHDQREAMELSDYVVVMHGGRVMQAGSPREVYHRPSSGGVAAFMGSPNLLSAEVTDAQAGGEGTILKVLGDGWQGQCRGADGIRAGDKVTVIVRTESIAPAGMRPACAEDITWSGEIVSASYQGPSYTIRVSIPGATLQAEVDAQYQPRVGERIALITNAAHAWAVPMGGMQ